MALSAVYERFLGSPNPLSLAENATLHYVTTLKTFSQSGPIVKHLEDQNKKEVKKKSEKIISAVEGNNTIALQVETTLEFISGGGAYLPGLENFVTDRIVTFPTTHFVQFDAEQNIQTIRISWDQGSLLKNVDVIGSRGKNWPIYDGKDQIRLISTNAIVDSASVASPMTPRGRDANGRETTARSMSPSKKHIKDPYASLDLFEPQKENRPGSHAQVIAPRASARPPPRDMSELFAAGHEDYAPSPDKTASPRKIGRESVVAPKGAGSQKFLPPRLFEEDPDVKSPLGVKSNPAKYNHFDLGEATDNDPLQYKSPQRAAAPGQIPMRPKTNKHQSQWAFEDFSIPAKVVPRPQSQHARNFSWVDEENAAQVESPGKNPPVNKPRPDAGPHFEFQDDGPEIPKPSAVSKPRRDAETHFELKDDGTPARSRQFGHAKGASQGHKGLGLYENHLYDDGSAAEPVEGKAPLKTITNNNGRKNDFSAHWEMDDNPSAQNQPGSKAHENDRPLSSEGRMKHVKTMSSSWDTYDESTPDQTRKPVGKVHKSMQSHWDFGNE